jgi:hypothetical protein
MSAKFNSWRDVHDKFKSLANEQQGMPEEGRLCVYRDRNFRAVDRGPFSNFFGPPPGVVEIDGMLYLVEMKWWDKPIGRQEIAPHFVSVFNRGDVGGIFISNSGFSPAASISKQSSAGLLTWRNREKNECRFHWMT